METDLIREKLINSCRSACFGTEFRRVYYDAYDIETASDSDIIQIAKKMGICTPEEHKVEDLN